MRENETSNKKAGKGNGNSIVTKESLEQPSNYVSGDETPSSSGHKFKQNTETRGRG